MALCFTLALGFAHDARAADEVASEVVQIPPVPALPAIFPDQCGTGPASSICARLNGGTMETMLTPHNQCYWLDNMSTKDYFVPYRGTNEWDDFISHVPSGVSYDGCCDTKQVRMGVLSDGRIIDAKLPVGRAANGARATSLTHAERTYNVNVSACVTQWDNAETCNHCNGDETLVLNGICNGAGWQVTTEKQNPVSCEPPPRYCPPQIASGTMFWMKTGSGSSAGPTASCHYGHDVESEFLCTDGTGSPTGTTRTVNQVLIGDCNPPPTTCVTTAPVDLVFAVDASGSMSSLVASTRAALASITNGILAGHNNVRMTVTAIGGDGYTPDPSSPIDSIDLGSYFPGFPSTIISDTCTVGKLYGPGGPSAAGVDAGFANLTSNHGTALGAGVTFAGQFLSPSTRKSAMIVLSDGFQGCTPDFNYLGAIQVQISRGVKMYGIAYNAPGVGYDPNYFSLFHSYAVADNPQTIYDAISQFVNQTVVTTCAPPCQGTMVGGFCWYMGQERKSCDEVCASHGGCNAAGTVSYAGSAGSDVQCSAVLGALGQPSTLQSVAAHQSPGVNANYAAMTGVGCSLMKNTVVTLVSPTTETYPTRVTTSNMLSTPTVHPTTCGANYEYAVMSGPSSADYYGARRACSCNN